MSLSPAAEERWRSGPGLLVSLWRYRWWVLAATVLAAMTGYLLSSLQPTTYEATTRLFLTDPRQAQVFGTQRSVDPQRYIPQQSERVTSAPVLERAAELLGEDLSPAEIQRQLSVEGAIELDLIEITGASQDAEQAAALANAAAEAYMQVAQENRLSAAREAADELESAAADLDREIAQLQEEDPDVISDQLDVLIRQRVDISSRAQQQLVEARVFGSGVDFVEQAVPPRAPSSPSPQRDAVLAAMVGAAIAGAAAYWRAGTTTRIESRREPAAILGAPLLGVLPLYRSKGDDLDDRLTLDAEAQESYEFLLSSLEYAMAPAGAKSVLITSAEPGQGKTEVSLQLAVTAVLQGRRTLLVDGDLRVRSLSHLFEADGGPGLVDLAVSAPRQYRTYVHNRRILGGQSFLSLLPAGSTADEDAASLRQPGIRRGLKVMGEELDLVLIDSAPLLATADTTTLSGSVDAMLVVVRAGTDVRDLQSLRERLSFTRCPVLGYVYITDDASDVGYAFGYGSYRYRHARSMRSEVLEPYPEERPEGDAPGWLREQPDDGVPSTAARPPLARRPDAATSSTTAAPEPSADERSDPEVLRGDPDELGETVDPVVEQ